MSHLLGHCHMSDTLYEKSSPSFTGSKPFHGGLPCKDQCCPLRTEPSPLSTEPWSSALAPRPAAPARSHTNISSYGLHSLNLLLCPPPGTFLSATSPLPFYVAPFDNMKVCVLMAFLYIYVIRVVGSVFPIPPCGQHSVLCQISCLRFHTLLR